MKAHSEITLGEKGKNIKKNKWYLSWDPMHNMTRDLSGSQNSMDLDRTPEYRSQSNNFENREKQHFEIIKNSHNLGVLIFFSACVHAYVKLSDPSSISQYWYMIFGSEVCRVVYHKEHMPLMKFKIVCFTCKYIQILTIVFPPVMKKNRPSYK